MTIALDILCVFLGFAVLLVLPPVTLVWFSINLAEGCRSLGTKIGFVLALLCTSVSTAVMFGFAT